MQVCHHDVPQSLTKLSKRDLSGVNKQQKHLSSRPAVLDVLGFLLTQKSPQFNNKITTGSFFVPIAAVELASSCLYGSPSSRAVSSSRSLLLSQLKRYWLVTLSKNTFLRDGCSRVPTWNLGRCSVFYWSRRLVPNILFNIILFSNVVDLPLASNCA